MNFLELVKILFSRTIGMDRNRSWYRETRYFQMKIELRFRLREVFTEIPNVKWEDVGGTGKSKTNFKRSR